jgi:hypothetical protein
MTTKASGRSALIFVTGLFVCLAGPSQAATDADNEVATAKSETTSALRKHGREGSHRWKRYTHRKSSEVAPKTAIASQAAAAGVVDKSSVISPLVANANAQMASADTPAGHAEAMSARANDILANLADVQPVTDTMVVAADQLNEIDRTLQESPPAAATQAMAAVEAPVAPAAPVMASSSVNSAWDETSLIGKIFIGFGALLTMASAARMFMA